MLKCTWHLKPDNSACWWHRMRSLLQKQQKHRSVSKFNCLWSKYENKKENPNLFLYTTKKKLIKEKPLFCSVLSRDNYPFRKGNRKKKKFLRIKSSSIPKTSLPKMTVLGCFISNYWCLENNCYLIIILIIC